MKTGTKSILFGAHCFLLHPWFVAVAWWQLYGFPFDPRLWVAFFVHDLGYWGKAKMDDAEGELHPFLGAKIIGWLFDTEWWNPSWHGRTVGVLLNWLFGKNPGGNPPDRGGMLTWYCFSFYHSRFLAKRYQTHISRLCVADKFSICLTPWWGYGPMATWSGEIHEYLAAAQQGKYQTMNLRTTEGVRVWHREMQEYLIKWVAEHKDLREDTWTPAPEKG